MLGWLVPLALAAPPTAVQVASLSRIEAVALSPDGHALVYALSTRTPPADGAEWTIRTQLWLVRGIGGTIADPRQLTTGEESASLPEFSPDGGAVAFLRDHGDKARLFVLPLDGGEAAPVDTGDLEPVLYAWAPDSQSFAFTAADPESAEAKKTREAEGDVERVGRYDPDRLYVVPRTGGQPTRIGLDRHVVSVTFAPDGKRVAVTLAPTADPYEVDLLLQVGVLTLADADLHLLGEAGNVSEPRFSPDGKKLAWLGTKDTLTLRNQLLVAGSDGSAPVDAARALDATFEAFEWAGNDAIVATTAAHTRTGVVKLAADGSRTEPIAVAGRSVMTGLAGDAAGTRFATVAQSSESPAEPAWFDLSGGSGIAAHPNDVSGWSLGKVELFAWKGPGGAALEGVLTMPPDAKGPVPLMVYPHGGPDGVSQEAFDPWAKYFAGRGYAVFRPNYRGGTGYGREFYAANRGKLGRIEFGDIESGVDALVRSGRVDAARLVYGGWSWGGYLTAWTIGHTQRYKAAVAGAAVVDVVSQYALSDVNHGRAAEWEFTGDPWRQPGKFAASNPMASLDRVTTPTLVLHGLADERVGYTSAMILYRALSDVGAEVELYAYPGEPHGFRDPRHVIHVLQSWGDWYDRHLGVLPEGQASRLP